MRCWIYSIVLISYTGPSPNMNSDSVISHKVILLAVFKNSHSVILFTLRKYSMILINNHVSRGPSVIHSKNHTTTTHFLETFE